MEKPWSVRGGPTAAAPATLEWRGAGHRQDPMPRTVALVEDDPDQRGNCADALRRHGYAVAACGSPDAARALFARTPVDLAILDIMLGDDHDAGFTLCRELLAADARLPVIFLSSRSDDIDRVSGLRLGAWDYLAKPVSLPFLAEKVATLFRLLEHREAGGDEGRRRVGELLLDPRRGLARWRGTPLELTLTEFQILQAIALAEGRGAGYDALAALTRQGVVENNTINTHVVHLRAKFRAVDPGFDAIRSVYGYGYRWDAP